MVLNEARSLPVALASCAVVGGIVGTIDATGGNLTGDGRDKESRESRQARRAAFFKKTVPVEAVDSSA